MKNFLKYYLLPGKQPNPYHQIQSPNMYYANAHIQHVAPDVVYQARELQKQKTRRQMEVLEQEIKRTELFIREIISNLKSELQDKHDNLIKLNAEMNVLDTHIQNMQDVDYSPYHLGRQPASLQTNIKKKILLERRISEVSKFNVKAESVANVFIEQQHKRMKNLQRKISNLKDLGVPQTSLDTEYYEEDEKHLPDVK